MVRRIHRPDLCHDDPLIDSSLKANMAAESQRHCADTSGWTALHHHALSAFAGPLLGERHLKFKKREKRAPVQNKILHSPRPS